MASSLLRRNRLDAMLTCFLLEAHEAPRLILAFVLQGIRAVAAAGLWRGTGLPVEPREAENARLSPPFRGYSRLATEIIGAQC
jgi:hypothetical protein